jgi:hypothetical protein
MRKALLALLVLCSTQTTWARKWTVAEVKGTIEKVNNYWQSHNPAEVRAFWDPAAYHTGNIEAYRLTGNERWLDYSKRWAEHNKWMGATERDPAKWLYKKYGESQQHVLFGDWQICFQTYLDIYNIEKARGTAPALNNDRAGPRGDGLHGRQPCHRLLVVGRCPLHVTCPS